jgi:autotransporter-associated beta strand protein
MTNSVHSRLGTAALAVGVLIAGGSSASAQTSWTRGAATAGLWSNSGQWNLSVGPVPDATTAVLIGVNTFDVLAQLQTTGATGVSASAAGITFTNTTSKVIRGQPNTNANANTHTLRLGSSGITVAEASLTTGTVVIYNAPTGNASSNVSTMVVEVNNAQTFTNNSASPLQFGRSDGLAGTLIRPGADSGAGTHALTLAGTGAGPISFYAAIQDQPADATKIRSLVVNRTGVGTGAVQLFGVNTYSGPTDVSAGTLLINGTNSGGGTTTVGSGGILGGTGSLAGPISFGSGGKFLFSSTAPLTVTGTVSFADPASFGIDDIVGLTSSVADGPYTLMSGSVSDVASLQNFGAGAAADLGSGKSAYFQQVFGGGLQAVVVPEPSTVAVVGIAFVLAASVRRLNRRRAR